MSAPSLSRALTAAFTLHPPIDKLPTMSIEEYRQANIARTSLLNDSWAHKVFALRRHFQLPINSLSERMSDTAIQQHEAIITEEWSEFWTGIMAGDLIEELDGGLDLIYTVLQYLLHRGFPPHILDACMEEIHAGSMTKVDENGKPVFINGKYQKTEHYVKPNLVEACRKATPPFNLVPTEESQA